MTTRTKSFSSLARNAFALLAGCSSALAAQDADIPLGTSIESVVLHAGSARIQRASAPLEAGGRYLVAGLPGALDPEHVRVRCAGGSVLAVEVRERFQSALPDARVQELRAQRAAKRVEIAVAESDGAVLARVETFLRELFVVAAPGAEPEEGRPMLEAGEARARWSQADALLGAELAANLEAQRENGWRLDALRRELSELEGELGRNEGEGSVRLFDVSVELELPEPVAAPLELEYFVSGCGWSPDYDLRTSGDARAVALTHRARVVQTTGEDWREVELALSTARPQRGASGPEPEARWIDLESPRQAERRSELALRGLMDKDTEMEEKLAQLGYAGDDALEPAPFASVESAGLSLVYRLPAAETIESRPEPTVVLVGEATLEVEPEHYCAPALSETVWLRGRAKNSSPWMLLPGPAAVFFGEDFLGHAQVGTVQRGEELTLHLGAVPALSIERIETLDETSGPGFLGSKNTRTRAWTVRAENHGARVCEPDGSVALVVREAIPRSTDDRVEVELTESEPEPSEDPRWESEREELGLHTWVLRVPRGGKAELVVELEIDYPKSLELWIR